MIKQSKAIVKMGSAVRKSLLTAFLTAIMIGGLTLVSTLHFGTVQASTNVIGIINADTTWTKANSPYTLTGPVAIGKGVTLTIDPGVTVNLGNYYIIVNGTLQAIGTDTDRIHFNGGTTGMLNYKTLNYAITFAPSSSSWNEQTGSGCIIENAILNATTISISNASPKIYNNTIDGSIRIQDYSTGNPIISNNSIIGIVRPWGVPDVPIEDDSSDNALISNNTLTNHSPNTGIGLTPGENDIVFGNVILNSTIGIYGGPMNAVISNNIISNCQTGIRFRTTDNSPIIENNLITNCTQTSIVIESGSFIIQNNTITNNGVGIQPSPSSTIIYNNIQNNNQSISLVGISNDVNATYNWWGTTDIQAINQTIYDFKYDFNLGKVNFVPFLTEPNPEAPAVTMTIPTPSQTTPQTGLNGIEIAILTILIVIVALLIVIIGLVLRKRR